MRGRWWDRLGDDELQARLAQRDIGHHRAAVLVENRDEDESWRLLIHDLLGDE